MAAVTLIGTRQTDLNHPYSNCVYTDPESFRTLYQGASPVARVGTTAVRCQINNFVLNLTADPALSPGTLAASNATRGCARLPLDREILVRTWDLARPIESIRAASITLVLKAVGDGRTVKTIDADLEKWCRERLSDQILTLNQSLILESRDSETGTKSALFASVTKIVGLSFGTEQHNQSEITSSFQGLIYSETEFEFEPADNAVVVKRTRAKKSNNLFKNDFNFEQLGIGGLDREFNDIFRRAFASRVFPPDLIEQLGIHHVRGMLLYGPPGTGKTLIARQIGKALRAKEPKIVNGPEVLNKFVGQSEENIRNLFSEAEADQKKMGNNSPLHIIIFDELDAICKQRGSVPSGAGVNDSIVNQLLAKIDGVNALNNILLIGMTNRMDMLDEALLRPGRLEVHIEIGLPDEVGRTQILRIHTNQMREAKRLGGDVDLGLLAARTKNFSGAEIAGLVRSAVSYSFARNVDPKNISAIDESAVMITQADFDLALDEIQPAFGVAQDTLSKYIRHGIIPFADSVNKLLSDLVIHTEQIKNSSPLISLLLWGSAGSGKTALAAHIAQLSGFPFVKFITPNDFVGFQESAKVLSINKCFDDAYKSDLSIVIIDDIERILDYTAIGPRFSNQLLQSLMILIKRMPPKEGRRLLVIGTTSEPVFIQESGLVNAFQLAYQTPVIKTGQSIQLCTSHWSDRNLGALNQSEILRLSEILYGNGTGPKIPVKKLFFALEMAAELAKHNTGGAISAESVISCLKDYGISS